MIVNIGNDSGKTNTKTVMDLNGEIYKDLFPTTAKKSETVAGDYVLIYDGVRYVTTDEPKNLTLEAARTTKKTITHKLAVLTGIYRILKKANVDLADVTEVTITINLPLSEFMNVEKRKEIVEFYQGNTYVNINNVDYHFKLNVRPYPEGTPVAMKNDAHLGNDEVMIIDLGSVNTTVLTYGENKRPIIDRCKPTPKSMRALLNEIGSAIHNKFDESYSHKNLRKIITNSKPGIAQEISDTPTPIIISWLENLKVWLEDNDMNPEHNKLIVAGGGAEMLKPHILRVFGQDTIIDQDGIYANAIGSLIMLRK